MKVINEETLDKAAMKFANDNSELYESSNHGSMYFGFYWGAQWQQERMYSEEEVMDMFHNLSMHLPLHYEFLVKEQFKNK